MGAKIHAVEKSSEIELKFMVPAAARAAVATELQRAAGSFSRETLDASYLDTLDRRLARAGISWRLRREGRRWVQTLKVAGAGAIERFEHEAIRPDATHDATEHAGTPAGDRLATLLSRARQDGLEPVVRFRTEVRRSKRSIRTRGAVVEVALDEGRLLAGERSLRLRELEFELVSGPVSALLALAERWRKRFGLILEPRSKSERGDRLAEGSPFPELRKAARPAYSSRAGVADAFGAVLDECVTQMIRNAAGLTEGDPALRVEHVHQMRVAIRRLRSALRIFLGWVPPPPAVLVEELRGLFATLGEARDSDVLGSGVAAALAEAGAPPLRVPTGTSAADPVATVRSDSTQHLLLAWIAWREGLDEAPPAATDPPQQVAPGTRTEAGAGDAQPSPTAPPTPVDLHGAAAKRLRRWHRRIAADEKAFDTLDEEALHGLRKRVKRQRYAVEFFAPVLNRRATERYLKSLAALQDRMGELNDLFVARALYQSLVRQEPAAWFALGWLAARIAEVRASVGPALRALAKLDPPTA